MAQAARSDYEGGNMGAYLMDSTRKSIRDFKQGEAALGASCAPGRFTSSSTHRIEGQVCQIAVRRYKDAAADAILDIIVSTMRKLERSFAIENDDLITDRERASLRYALIDDGSLDLSEGTSLVARAIPAERVARIAWILDTRYDIVEG